MMYSTQFVTSENSSTSPVTQNHPTAAAKPDDCLQSEQGEFVPWDNPDNIITRETEVWISMSISLGGIPALWVIGMVGNVLSGAVFCRQGLSSRINLCLFCLALADLVSLTVLFLLYVEGAYRTLIGHAHFFITYFVGLTGFTFVSQLLSTVIAFERCLCVVNPLKAQRMMSTRKMAVFIGMSSMVLLGGMLVAVGNKHTVACVNDPLTNVTKDIVYVTSYYLNNKEIIDIFDVFVFSTAIPAIFMTVVIVTTIVTANKLRSAMRWRHQSVYDITRETPVSVPNSTATTLTTDQKGKTPEVTTMALKEVALTRMLMATSLLFVVCLMPCLALQIATFLVDDLRYNGRYHNLITVLWALVSFCRALNSSLNVFVYYAMGSRFRETLREILLCCCSTRH